MDATVEMLRQAISDAEAAGNQEMVRDLRADLRDYMRFSLEGNPRARADEEARRERGSRGLFPTRLSDT